MADTTNILPARVRRFITDPSGDDFGALALAAHDYQYRHNPVYTRFVDRLGSPPPTRWEEIPAVPALAFKESALTCAPAANVFLSSGTTAGPEHRAHHHVPDLALYRLAAITGFQRAVLPAGERRPFLVAAPEHASHPLSSLGAMVSWLRTAHDSGDEPSFLVDGGVSCEALGTRLEALDPDRPMLLLAVTTALLRLADHAETRGRCWRLPAGSLVVDTGGCKGYGQDLERVRILARYRAVLGIDPPCVINEYGMTELCSQLYARGDEPHRPPPWVRTVVVDPATGDPVPHGRPGLLRHLDLANLGSVIAVQTEDVGRALGNGIELLGRVAGAEARGCSLLLAS
jgi:hypothetical protein